MHRLFLETVDTVRPLLDHTQLAKRWEEPSCLERMTIGSLTAHLTRAATLVSRYLETEGKPPLLDAPGYYINMMEQADTDLDSQLAVSVRERADADAAPGLETVRDRWDELRARLGESLPMVPEDRAIGVRAASMTVHEYLRTRLVEMVVHADDLAASLGVDPPALPEDATRDVLACLIEIASRRSGTLDVIRAVSRVERGDPTVLRVF